MKEPITIAVSTIDMMQWINNFADHALERLRWDHPDLDTEQWMTMTRGLMETLRSYDLSSREETIILLQLACAIFFTSLEAIKGKVN